LTLQQAHEIQRRELISLRAENKRLKEQASGMFTSEERDALERRVRQLEQMIKSEAKRHEDARAYWKLTKDRCCDQAVEIVDLKEQIASLQEENEALRIRAEKAEAEVCMLNGTNKKLERRLNVSFENSSLPSSAQPFRKKIPNGRKATGRKPGAQPGHKHHSAARLNPTNPPIHLTLPDELVRNADIYATGRTIVKQLIDVRFVVTVQDYVADEYRNRITGARFHAPFPAGIVNPVNYGSSVKALAFLLNNYYNVSMAKTAQCISDLTRGIVTLSTGTICNLASEFSAATESERAKIFSLLTHSDVLYSDATVSNVNGVRKAVFLCTDKKHILYQHFDHKGHEGILQTPVKDFSGVLVHDHDRSFYTYGTAHQECMAHVLRYLVDASENEPHLKWHDQMHTLIREMIHSAKQNPDGIPKEKVRELTEKYDSILDLAADEYSQNPPSVYYPNGYNLQKRLREYRNDHLYFLTHPHVDYTNNVSERGLRKFKRKQKQAVVLRSDSGGRHICDALTIIETARLQHKNVYSTIEAAFSK
jgi:hypothetical protein